jgi:MSHA biogenesis protein MshL
MKKSVFALAAAMALAGCSGMESLRLKDDPSVARALEDQRAAVDQKRAQAELAEVRKAMQEMTPTPVAPKVEERRFNLAAKDLSAQAAYQAIAEQANYNVIIASDVTEKITIHLKDVTTQEALEALRDAYGLEFDVTGRRLMVTRAKVQNRTFQMDYLLGSRSGKSEVRVSSGSVADGASGQGANGSGNGSGTGTQGSGGASRSQEDGSKVTTTIQNDFWQTLEAVLKGIVAGKDGQEIVINPQSGLVFVKAWPAQLREVEQYLERTQNKVSRQVVLEAKIVQVTLSSGSQSGINWSSFDSRGNHKYSVGANSSAVYPQGGGFISGTALGGAAGLLNSATAVATSGAGGLGLAFTGTNFAALMSFLQSQGETQVLSAPRVATLNNQKAVLKVGRDEFFVTNVSTTSTNNGNSTTNSPTINVQPFFSGIALDVTPQIDDNGFVILHVHPSVSDVAEKSKVVNLGSLGTFTLPLASSNINESDTIVRLLDGDIVAIGGLMSSTVNKDGSKVPLVGDVPGVGNLFKQHADSSQKTELVILIKPTVINKPTDWAAASRSAR